MNGDFPRSLLRPGERVVWHGAPAGGVPLRTRDLFLIPFSLLWCGFAIFWEASAVRDGAGWFFALWGVPFVLTGLFAVAGRFLAEMWLRARTRYAVTDRRVLIERDGPWGMLQTIDLADVGD